MRRFAVFAAVLVYLVVGIYVPALADGTVDDAHNWHFGPHLFDVFKDGNVIAGTENYMAVHTVSGTNVAYVNLAYIQWAAGSCVKQKIFARIYDNTAGRTVEAATITASTCNKSTFFAPDRWLANPLPAHTYHLHYIFSVWTTATGWVDAAAQDSSPWSCTSSNCTFT
jgi:hypothetical protein